MYFISVHCEHFSTYVTATVSIVPVVRVFIGHGTLSLSHTTVPFDPRLVQYTRTSRIHFPATSLHTAQECKVDTLCDPCTTLSHIDSST